MPSHLRGTQCPCFQESERDDEKLSLDTDAFLGTSKPCYDICFLQKRKKGISLKGRNIATELCEIDLTVFVTFFTFIKIEFCLVCFPFGLLLFLLDLGDLEKHK